MRRVALVLSLLSLSLAALAQQSPISAALLATIKKLSPTASLLQPNEVNLRDCEDPKGPPGLVQADFNGDGLQDAAVLIKAHVARELKTWEGQQYREASLLFAVLLNDGEGGYRVARQKKYPDQIPSFSYLEAIPPGRIRGTSVMFRNPGVMLIFCGKSATAYMATGKSVKEIPLSD